MITPSYNTRNTRIASFCFAALIAFSLISCTKQTNVAGPQGPAGPKGPAGSNDSSVGVIQGAVKLYDVNGVALSDNSGANVSIENSSPLVSATSATDGSFNMGTVHAGNYTLDLVKTGFGRMRFLNFQHPGGAVATQTGILSTGLRPDSSFNIQLQVDTGSYGPPNYYLSVTIRLNKPQKFHNPILLFFSDSANATNGTSLYTWRSQFFQQDDSTVTYTPFNFYPAEWSDRLHNAANLYISAAVDNVKTLSYTDENGVTIYPCAGNLSNVVKVPNVFKN